MDAVRQPIIHTWLFRSLSGSALCRSMVTLLSASPSENSTDTFIRSNTLIWFFSRLRLVAEVFAPAVGHILAGVVIW
jgi:hypothetical protein